MIIALVAAGTLNYNIHIDIRLQSNTSNNYIVRYSKYYAIVSTTLQ